MDERNYYNKEDVQRILESRIQDAGSVANFCKQHNLLESQIRIAREHQNPPVEVLRALGLRAVTAYERA